jgi:superfamily II DNA or RNA helicase
MEKSEISVREKVQKEALKQTSKHKRCGLDLSMGIGKTYIGLQYLEMNLDLSDSKKALVVAPKVDIFESWKVDANKFNLGHLLDHIVFSTYVSLIKHNPLDYQITILDEAHNTKNSHRPYLEDFDGLILGLTGTPPKWANSEKGEAMEDFYPIVYSYHVDDAVDNGILNDYRIYVHKLKLSSANTMLTKNGWKTSEQKNYEWLRRKISESVTDKQKFMAQIMCLNGLKQYQTKQDYVKYALSRIPEDEKCLIFANTIEQAEQLCSNTHHSKKKNSDDLEEFKKGNIFRLSAVEQLSEGITVPNLKHIIILHAYGNEKRASQKIGRALRLSINEIAKIHILMYEKTIDEEWVKRALEGFNQDKIKYITPKI